MVRTEAEFGKEKPKPVIYRYAEEGLKVIPEVGYFYPTLQDLADLIYPDRPNARSALSKFAGRIGLELGSNERLKYILQASEFAGISAMGLTRILRRNIPYGDAQRMTQRARGASHQIRGSRVLVEPKASLAEIILEAAQRRGIFAREVKPETSAPAPEIPAVPRILGEAHVYKLLDFFSHMTTLSKVFYGLEIPQTGQIKMLEVMDTMRRANPTIEEESRIASVLLPQILLGFPLDESGESQAKRHQFLAANEGKLARNLLGVMQSSTKPERYSLLLSNLPIRDHHLTRT